jgi:hypothetical protein
MEELQLNRVSRRGHTVRLALGGAVAGVVALFVFPASVSANQFFCTTQEAAVWVGSRIHVLCNPGDGAITFFALSVSNSDASRVLSLIEAAVAARKTLSIVYDPSDLSGAAIGCANTNCRLIQAVALESQ